MPIIKSIGRKDTNFKQLIDYLHRLDGGEEETFTYVHNMLGVAPDDVKGMEQAFQDNNQYRRKRKNGIGQYHEVMSFHPEDRETLLQHPEILEDLARVYLELRAPGTVAIARPHTDKNHLHLHFMISANELGKAKSIRLSKQKFQAIRRTIEDYQLVYYPELKGSYVHSRDQGKYHGQEYEQTTVSNHNERQMEKRGLMVHDKKELSSTVRALLNNTDDMQEFKQILNDYKIETYQYKGRLQGVKFNGRKYRFGRLLPKNSQEMEVVNKWNADEKEREQGLDLGLGL